MGAEQPVVDLRSDVSETEAPPSPERPGSVESAYDLVAHKYDRLWNGPLAFAENHHTFSRLRQIVSPELDILDVGSGTGLLLDWLAPWVSPARYHGIDIATEMVRVARRKHPQFRFSMQDADALWPTTQRFDLVVSTFAAFSYLRQPARALNVFRSILRPGGRLLLQPFGPGVLERPDYDLLDGLGRVIPYKAWQASELRELLAACGFQRMHVYGMTSLKLHEAMVGWTSPFYNDTALRAYEQDLNGDLPMFLWADATAPNEE